MCDLHASDEQWRPFIAGFEGTLVGHAIGDEYVAVTDHDAPRGRLVAVPLDGGSAEDPATWRELVPEGDAVLRWFTPVGDQLYLYELVDVYARVRIVNHDGDVVGRAELPSETGALAEGYFPLMALGSRGHPDEYVFAFSSLTESWGVYRHRLGHPGVETLKEPDVRLTAVVEELEAPSADGTLVPYRVVRRPDLSPDKVRPALVWIYGGYNCSLLPEFPREMAAFVDAGGIFVHGHIRGGGDFGRDWYEGGCLANKQNCFDDVNAIARHLVATGRSTSEQLGMIGDSNGGLVAAGAVTQAPDLWRAAVLRGPWLDLLGESRRAYGRACVASELGDFEDPQSVARIAGFSPYQNIKHGTAYPAIYVTVGATDQRVAPGDARKFAARMQEATSSERPVLLRVWDNAGHGAATAVDVEVAQNTAWLAFVMAQVGMTVALDGSENQDEEGSA